MVTAEGRTYFFMVVRTKTLRQKEGWRMHSWECCRYYVVINQTII